MGKYLKRPTAEDVRSKQIRDRVAEMLDRIQSEREGAVREFSRELDGWDAEHPFVSEDEIRHAEMSLPGSLIEHIQVAQEQVRNFAEHQRRCLLDLEIESQPGIILGHRHVPVDSVGAYVPGGRYRLIATSFMTILVARTAGVTDVVAATPPMAGDQDDPAVLYAVSSSGANRILRLGGVQALATMAFGLFGLDPVAMLVGPGNAYVAEAKRQLFGYVGIDLVAGPTEILVVADEQADPELVAIDLLGQAEHGLDSPAWVIATSEEVGARTIEAAERLLTDSWPNADIAGPAWRDHGLVYVAEDRQEAVDMANELAAEHVELQVAEDEFDWYEAQLRNYGSLFVGDEATVAYGDKGIGTNHVLPTARAARYTGGLWVGKFLKTLTYQRATETGTKFIAPTIDAVATREGMLGHALTARVRLDGREQALEAHRRSHNV